MFQDLTGTNSVYTSMPCSDVPKSQTLRRSLSRWGWKSPTKPQSSIPIRSDSSYVSIQSSLQGRRFGAKQLIPVRKTLFPVPFCPSQTQTRNTNIQHAWCMETALRLLTLVRLTGSQGLLLFHRLFSQYSNKVSSFHKSETEPTFWSSHPSPCQD